MLRNPRVCFIPLVRTEKDSLPVDGWMDGGRAHSQSITTHLPMCNCQPAAATEFTMKTIRTRITRHSYIPAEFTTRTETTANPHPLRPCAIRRRVSVKAFIHFTINAYYREEVVRSSARNLFHCVLCAFVLNMKTTHRAQEEENDDYPSSLNSSPSADTTSHTRSHAINYVFRRGEIGSFVPCEKEEADSDADAVKSETCSSGRDTNIQNTHKPSQSETECYHIF